MALTVSGVGGVAVLAGGLSLFLALRLALRTQFDDVLRRKAEILASASAIDNGELEIDPDVQTFAGFGTSSPGDYFEIFAPDGTVLDRSPSLGTSSLKEVGISSHLQEGVTNSLLPGGLDVRAYWRYFTPSDDEEDRFADLKLVVASDRARLKRLLSPIATTIALVGGGGIVVILALLRIVVGRGLRPLDQLGAEVQQIHVERLSGRLATDDLPVELRGMAGKLNELLERLEATFARERRFTSHAAHELRTPLAELKAMTELGAAWPEEFTPEHVSEMLLVISELEALIEKLSLLARAEAGTPGPVETILLEETVGDCLARQKREILSRNLVVDCQIEPGEFASDPVLWRAIIHNLINNAVSYAPEQSTIEIRARPRFFSVSNEAPGLTSDDLDKLFERFWRKEPQPHGGHGGQHSGLGLSIVRASADFLGGRCEASLESGRLAITIDFRE